MGSATEPLAIFDCGGVLADSVPISITLLMDHCRESDFQITDEEAYTPFLGKPLFDAAATVKRDFDRDIAPVNLLVFQIKVLREFCKKLRPITKIKAALASISLPKCVVSSSNMARIPMSLTLTGLEGFFQENMFSTDLVERRKPHAMLPGNFWVQRRFVRSKYRRIILTIRQ